LPIAWSLLCDSISDSAFRRSIPDTHRTGRRSADSSTIICFKLCIFQWRSAGVASEPPCCHLPTSHPLRSKVRPASLVPITPVIAGSDLSLARARRIFFAFNAEGRQRPPLCLPPRARVHRRRNRLQNSNLKSLRLLLIGVSETIGRHRRIRHADGRCVDNYLIG
jgi:hypothetical protein